MDNCEEISCVNVQSATCLHCLHRLCVTHIVAHEPFLLKESDQLCEQTNELAEQLNVCLQQIHIAREEATHKLNIWRQNQIDKVENKYAEKVQDIEFRKDHLNDLENELTKRITIEVKQALENIKIRHHANSQSLQIIRQAIANIVRDSIQLELCSQDPSSQSSSSSSIINTTVADSSSLLPSNLSSRQYVSSKTKYLINSTTHPLDPQSVMASQFSFNQTTSIVASNAFSNPATTMQTIMTPYSASTTSKPTTTSTAATSPSSRTIIKRPPVSHSRVLVKLFQNVSGSSDGIIQQYIVNNLHRAVHVNSMMVLLLSFLKAWHSSKSPTVVQQDVLSYHINIVKNYIKGHEHQLTVIAAIQVFVTSCNYDENKSSEMITTLFQFFTDHQCITEETIHDWYKNGAYYGYTGFEKTKIYAKPFIDQLNTNIES